MAVPKLRFKEFSENWKLDQVGKFLIEYKEKVPSSTDIEIYSSSRDGLKPQKEYFDNRELQNFGEYGVVPPSYFTYRHMSDDTTFKFNINLVGKKIAVSKEYPVFTTNELMDSSFLLLKLNESNDFKRFAIEQKKGGTRTRLYFKALCNWETLLPVKAEQTKIASFLSAVDEKISQLTQKHALLSQYKQGMMQKLFSQQICFKADDGSEFGEWVDWKFASCIDIFDNLRKPVSASERKVGFTPYYGANGIQSYIDGYTHEGEFILIAEDGANDLINYPVQYVNGKIWVNNHAHVVSGKQHIVDNKFLKYRLGSIDFTKYLVGGGRAKLNAGAMKEIAFLLPCLEEQTKIANFLSAIDQKIEVVAQQIEQAKTWKKGLLQQMFV